MWRLRVTSKQKDRQNPAALPAHVIGGLLHELQFLVLNYGGIDFICYIQSIGFSAFRCSVMPSFSIRLSASQKNKPTAYWSTLAGYSFRLLRVITILKGYKIYIGTFKIGTRSASAYPETSLLCNKNRISTAMAEIDLLMIHFTAKPLATISSVTKCLLLARCYKSIAKMISQSGRHPQTRIKANFSKKMLRFCYAFQI